MSKMTKKDTFEEMNQDFIPIDIKSIVAGTVLLTTKRNITINRFIISGHAIGSGVRYLA